MPTPREAYVNSADRQGYSGARVQAADYGASGQIIARSVQGFGQDLQKVGDDLDETQTIYATAAAKKADTSAMMRLSAIASAVKNTEGFDTTAAMTQAQADIDALEKEHLAALKSPRAQRMFSEVFAQRKANALSSMSEYEHDQVRVAHKNESIAHRDTSINMAVDNFANREEFDRNVGAAMLDVEDILKGAGPEMIAAEKAKVVSTAHAQVIEALNAKQDFLGAEAWRMANSGQILPDTESQLLRSNAPGLFDSRIDIMWEAVASGSTSTGLAETEVEPASGQRPINPIAGKDYNPVAGARRTGDAASHARRGSTNKGIDFAAPEGSAIHPPMSGKVAERGYNDSNGHYVKVAYDNGLTGIFLHLKTPPPVDRGDPVGPGTIIGAVGNTGKSRGAHVHYSVKDGKGNYVDPDTVRYEGGSGPKSPRYKPEDTNTAALFDRIYSFAEKNNLTGRETDALIQRANGYANANQALKNEDEARRTDAAMEQATALGEKLTKPGQIPGYANLPWQAKDRINDQIARNTQPVEPAANGIVDTDMAILEIEDPQEFLRKNPFALNMTRAEQQSMAVRQAKLRKDMAGGGTVVNARAKAHAAGELYLGVLPGIEGAADKADEKKLKIKFYDHLERLYAAKIAANGGKTLAPGEYDRLAAESAMAVTVGEERVPLFMANEKGGTVKMSPLNAAKLGWRRANPGQPLPSDSWFLRQMGQ